MIKKKILLLIPIFLFSFSISAYAKDIFLGSVVAGEMPNVLLASGTELTDTWSALTVGGSNGTIIWYKYNSDGTKTELGRSNTPGTNIKAPAGANAFLLVSNDGGKVYAAEGWTTNTNADHVLFETPYTDSNIFNMPGWSDYMSKMDQILAAIPPSPNWSEVAATFRDTITPKIKSDLQEVLGTAPSPQTAIDTPAAPTAPTAPSLDKGNLDNRGLTEPTGENAPGLDGSGFSADDIKNGAPAIEERTDPTGGFSILDPIGALPSQDEFMKNIPSNPAVPNVTEPQIGKEPTFTEPTYTMPTFTEPTYTMPTFTQPTFTMPTFTEKTFTSPSVDYNTAPTPSQGGTAAEPIIGNFNTAPIPSQTLTAPLPGTSP